MFDLAGKTILIADASSGAIKTPPVFFIAQNHLLGVDQQIPRPAIAEVASKLVAFAALE